MYEWSWRLRLVPAVAQVAGGCDGIHVRWDGDCSHHTSRFRGSGMKHFFQFFLPLFSGLVFGIGLVLSGMTNPSKVQGFLDIGGAWDPSLALVMGGAVCVTLPVFQWVIRREPDHRVNSPVDGKLLVGSALFGVGWGMSGYCPGPALVVAGSGSATALIYVLAMAVGMIVANRFASSERSGAPQVSK